MKLLPKKNYETQAESYAKKGKSVFGAMFYKRNPDNEDGSRGSISVSILHLACEDSKQNALHAVATAELALKTYVASFPGESLIFHYFMDNAGRPHTLSTEYTAYGSGYFKTPVTIHGVAALNRFPGIQVSEIIFCEAGEGRA